MDRNYSVFLWRLGDSVRGKCTICGLAAGMGNNSSRQETIVDYDDEEDALVTNSEPYPDSILLEDEEIVEDGHPKLHHSPIIRSLVSLTKESLIAFQPNENIPISLEKKEEKQEKQEPESEITPEQKDEIVEVEEKKENPICLEKEPLSESKAPLPSNRVNLFDPFSIQFRVDTEVEASLKLYWGASSRRKPKDSFKSRFANGHYAMSLSKGLNQVITIDPSHLPRFQLSDLKYLNGETDSCIPLLIQLQARSGKCHRIDKYLVFDRTDDRLECIPQRTEIIVSINKPFRQALWLPASLERMD